jgi:hypothetical protein
MALGTGLTKQSQGVGMALLSRKKVIAGTLHLTRQKQRGFYDTLRLRSTNHGRGGDSNHLRLFTETHFVDGILMKTAFIGLIIGFSIAGNIYGYMLHNGQVVSVKAACAEYVDGSDILTQLERKAK